MVAVFSAGALAADLLAGFKSFVIGGSEVSDAPDDKMAELAFGCISCHDGTTAKDVYASTVGVQTWRMGMGEHPVGMDYRASYLRKQEELNPREFLPASIILVDGVVSCLSCHKLSEEAVQASTNGSTAFIGSTDCTSAGLTVSNEGSRLCMSCHNL